MTRSMLISVCILAKNCEYSLPNALISAIMLGDEIIIRLDRESTDSTLSLVREFELRTKNKLPIVVEEYDFVGFGSARNGLISTAQGEWIFMLDSDETLDTQGIQTIRSMTSGGLEHAIYTFPRKNWSDLFRTSYKTDYYPDKQRRLFPNSKQISYEDQLVHEVPKGMDELEFPDKTIHINHFCFAYRSSQDWHDVNRFYADLHAQQEGR